MSDEVMVKVVWYRTEVFTAQIPAAEWDEMYADDQERLADLEGDESGNYDYTSDRDVLEVEDPREDDEEDGS